MKNFKFLIIIVILLVIINCVLLGSLWFTKYHMAGPPPPMGPPERANEYLIRELKMTPAQVKQYDAMKKQHFEVTRKLNDQNRLLRDEFFKNIQTPVLNKTAVDSLQKKISANSVTLDTTTLFHFRKLRTILTHEQQTKFDNIIQNALHMMGGPQKGGAGPGGPPPANMRPQGPPPPGAGKHGMRPPRDHRPGMRPPGGPPPIDGYPGPPPGGGPPDRDFMPPPGGPPRPGMPPPPGARPGMPPPDGPPPGY